MLRPSPNWVAAVVLGWAILGFAPSARSSSEMLIKACAIACSKEQYSSVEALRAFVCFAYLGGFAVGYTTGEKVQTGQRGRLKGVGLCVPANMSSRNLAEAYVAWAMEHPEHWHLPQHQTVFRALADRWQCRR